MITQQRRALYLAHAAHLTHLGERTPPGSPPRFKHNHPNCSQTAL